jgi:acetyl esterase
MTVIPELEPMLLMAAAMPALDFDDIAGLRAQGEAMPDGLLGLYVPPVEDVSTEVTTIPVADGSIELRIHRRDGLGPEAAPAFVSLHGGGWILGSARGTDLLCRRLASLTGLIVVSVDYRLAPEHRFPVPLEDCYEALQWVVDHAVDLGVDVDDISIGGQSAGGNLAAGLALLCRDRGGPSITAQWLEVPCLDLTLPDDDSLRDFGVGFGLDHVNIDKTAACFASDEDRRTPYCSPLLADDLHALPPAVITTGGCDPLRDQGARYADALRAAGVPVRYSSWDGHLHATMSLLTLAESGAAYEAEVLEALSEARAKGRR